MNVFGSPRATMLDVARRAGVSEKSVSRVVNREPHVSQNLREKVEAAIAELGYVPDPAARSLAGVRSFTIGLLLDSRGLHYSMKLMEGAYEACRSFGYHLQVENLDSKMDDAAQVARLENILRTSRLDGVIVTPLFADNPAMLDFLEQQGMPYARVAPFIDRDRAPAVFMDDAAAAGEVADLLVTNGHRRIGLVTGPPRHGAAIARRTGFMERIAMIAPDAVVTEANGYFRFKDGIAAGHELLDVADRPTAIFATNDDSAAGVMTACAQLGITIPDDVSICGFDDNLVAKSVWPYLTTVHQPIAELARQAAHLLLDRHAANRGPASVLLPHRLVERDTIRNLRASEKVRRSVKGDDDA